MSVNSPQDSGIDLSSINISNIDFSASPETRESAAPTLDEAISLSAPIHSTFQDIAASIKSPRPLDSARVSALEPFVANLEAKREVHQSKMTVNASLDKDLTPKNKFSLDYLGIDKPGQKEQELEKIDAFISQEAISASLDDAIGAYDKTITLTNLLSFPYKTPANLPLRVQELAVAVVDGTYSVEMDEENPIGKGSYGSIYPGTLCGTPVAIKSPARPSHPHHIAEYDALCALKEHPYILKLLTGNESELYLELAEGGSLQKPTQALTASDLGRFVYQVADALAYTHEKGFIHRDIHIGNILLAKRKGSEPAVFDVRLADFGTAIKTDKFNSKRDGGGTIRCMAPEIAMKTTIGQEHVQKMDTWSFGIMIWDLLSNESLGTPFDSVLPAYRNDVQLLKELQKLLSTFTGFEPDVLKGQLDPTKVAKLDPHGHLTSIMIRCLTLKPESRPSMADVRDTLKVASTPKPPASSRFSVTTATPSRFTVTPAAAPKSRFTVETVKT